MPKKKLTPMEYHAKHDKAHLEAMCARAGTSYSYWKHIKDMRKRPSVDLARALVRESGGALDLDALLIPKEAMRTKGAAPLTVGSARA